MSSLCGSGRCEIVTLITTRHDYDFAGEMCRQSATRKLHSFQNLSTALPNCFARVVAPTVPEDALDENNREVNAAKKTSVLSF